MLFTWVDVETDPEVDRLLKQFGVTEADTPVVACGAMLLLRNPSNRQLADAIGIRQPLEDWCTTWSWWGPARRGWRPPSMARPKGCGRWCWRTSAPGGQAGSSMRIENYLGFPTGLTGSELAGRAILQANKFGAHLSVPTPVNRLAFENAYPVVHLDGGETVTAKCLLIATGADYRRLGVEGCERFEGTGVYYAATLAEAQLCRGRRWWLWAAAIPPARRPSFSPAHARQVLLLIRGDDLYKNMSSYLARRIEQTPNIELLCNTTIRRMNGDTHLRSVEIVNSKTGRGADGRDPGGVQLHRRRAADRLAARRRSRGTPRGSSGPARSWRSPRTGRPRASRFCWRPAAPACSRPGTCAPARSSAWPRPWAKARWRCSSCTSASSTCKTQGAVHVCLCLGVSDRRDCRTSCTNGPGAAVSWAARLGWLHPENTWLAFMGSAITPYILSVLAIGEMINDKLPKTPSRKAPASFGALSRIPNGARKK